MKVKTKDGHEVKPISELTDEEMAENNIVERDGMLYYKTVKEGEVIKPISECSDEEKEKNSVVEKDGKIFL
jgi:hypothetical protein